MKKLIFTYLVFLVSGLIIDPGTTGRESGVKRSLVIGENRTGRYAFSSIQGHEEPLDYLFESGTNGYNTFRIPAIICTKRGTLLAFAEGRKKNSSDTGDIDLVLKRSEDNGKTWSELAIVWDDGENVCGNPAPVQDEVTGNIYLLSTWNLGDDQESEIISGTSRDSRRIFVLVSSDDGRSWSKASEITGSVKDKNWTWYATGPCHGIQIKNGEFRNRLIIPCDHIDSGTEKYYSHIIYSDDKGRTWQPGGTTPQDKVNECSVAELTGGRLMLNMRNYDRTQKTRKVSLSYDGGLTWSGIFSDPVLIEPICQGSLLSSPLSDNIKNRLFFLNPADEKSREKLTLRISYDEGKTWAVSKVLHSGPSAYSDLTSLPSGDIGCLYEAGEKSPYSGIVFQKISIKELEE
jgi:sialidase-1